ncbi:MAG: hypothetical protein F7B17_06565 [Desulfurococcales archaeon]|nr:hypothetical protein [Desulfurococcales archaeon]
MWLRHGVKTIQSLFLLLGVLIASIQVPAASDPEAPIPPKPPPPVGPGVASPSPSAPASIAGEPATLYRVGDEVVVAPWSLDGSGWLVKTGWPSRASWSGEALAIAGPLGAALVFAGGLSLTQGFEAIHNVGDPPYLVTASGGSMAALYPASKGAILVALKVDPLEGSGVVLKARFDRAPQAASISGDVVVLAFIDEEGVLFATLTFDEVVGGILYPLRLQAPWVRSVCPINGLEGGFLAVGGGRLAFLDVDGGFIVAESVELEGAERCIAASSSESAAVGLVASHSGLILVWLYPGGPAFAYRLEVLQRYEPTYMSLAGSSLVMGLSSSSWSISVSTLPRAWGSLAIVAPWGEVIARLEGPMRLDALRLVEEAKPSETLIGLEGAEVAGVRGRLFEALGRAPVAGAAAVSGKWVATASGLAGFFHSSLLASRLEVESIAGAAESEGLSVAQALEALRILSEARVPASIHAARALRFLEGAVSWVEAGERAYSVALESSGVVELVSNAGPYLKPTILYHSLASLNSPDALSRLKLLVDPQRLASSPAATRDPSLPSSIMVELAQRYRGPDGLEWFIALVNGLPGMDAGAGVEVLPWATPIAFQGRLAHVAYSLALSGAFERALSILDMASKVVLGEPVSNLPGACAVLGPVGRGNADTPPYVAPYDPVNIDLHRTTLKSHYAIVDCGWEVSRVKVGPPSYVPFITSIAFMEASIGGQTLYLAAGEVLIDGQAVPRLLMAVGSEGPPIEGEWAITVWEVSSGSLRMTALSPGVGRAIVAVYAGGYKLYLGPPPGEGERLDSTLIIAFTGREGAVEVEGGLRLPTYPSSVEAYMVSEGTTISVEEGRVNVILAFSDTAKPYSLEAGLYTVEAGEIVAVKESKGDFVSTLESLGEPSTPSGGNRGTAFLVQGAFVAIMVGVAGVLFIITLLAIRRRAKNYVRP